jgi:stress-induced-phosphoprotein 1
MEGFERPEGSTDLPEGLREMNPEAIPTEPVASSSGSAMRGSPPSPPPAATISEIVEEQGDDDKAKAEAEAEKKKGGEAYKTRDFATAEKAYQRAWEIWPKDIVYLTNLAGLCSLHLGGMLQGYSHHLQ